MATTAQIQEIKQWLRYPKTVRQLHNITGLSCRELRRVLQALAVEQRKLKTFERNGRVTEYWLKDEQQCK